MKYSEPLSGNIRVLLQQYLLENKSVLIVRDREVGIYFDPERRFPSSKNI